MLRKWEEIKLNYSQNFQHHLPRYIKSQKNAINQPVVNHETQKIRPMLCFMLNRRQGQELRIEQVKNNMSKHIKYCRCNTLKVLLEV